MKKKLLIVVITLLLVVLAACTNKAKDITPDEASIRSSIVGLDAKVTLANGDMVSAINFDNAATTPAFTQVLETVEQELTNYGSIGRGTGQKSGYSTAIYEDGRQTVLDFFGASADKYTAIYVTSTTDGLNKLAQVLIDEDDVILTTRMEHHANDLPWRHNGTIVYAEVDEFGRLSVDELERVLQEQNGAVRFVTVTAASNVTGYTNDLHAIAAVAHKYGAKFIVDGAQIAAHCKVVMQNGNPGEDIDYLVFSAHKMYAPFGSGAIVGLKEQLNECEPTIVGGGIVERVSDSRETYEEAPARYEPGSPNYTGVVAMLKAMDVLTDIGFDYIEQHERRLLSYTLEKMRTLDGVILYGDSENIEDRVGIVTFNVEGMTSTEVAQALADKSAISVRQGGFCAHTYVARLMGVPESEIEANMDNPDYVMPSMVRASFGIYNTQEEVDIFIDTLQEILAERSEKK